MARPSLADNRSNTMDSTTLVSFSDLVGSKDGFSASYSSVNGSSTSLGKRALSDAYSFQQTPPIGSGTSQLNNLVCSVHRTTGKRPHGLVGASTTILGDKLYVFGGRRMSNGQVWVVSDLYELDLLRRHWTRIETRGKIPSPRFFHSVCALGDSKLVCFGGMGPEINPDNKDGDVESEVHTVLADIHIYDVPTQTWMKVHTPGAPQGRYAHCATILPSSAVFASANAPLSAIHRNPSDRNSNSGSTGVTIDGTGGAQMVVVGGQDGANVFIEEVNVFNLRNLEWTSSTKTEWHNCGAYRSVVAPLEGMKASEVGAGFEHSSDEDDYDNASNAGSPMLFYNNRNFVDVKLDLKLRLVDGSVVEKVMETATSPPPLRFPSGGIINNHLVVAGTTSKSTEHEFALWALNLRTLVWAKVDVGSSVFSSGSWNRGILWPRRNSFVVLGDRNRSMVEDYAVRRLNFSEMSVVQLEAFGLYDNPIETRPRSSHNSASAPLGGNISELLYRRGPLTPSAVNLGQAASEVRELADMDMLTLDGTRIPFNSRIVARRWGSMFNNLIQEAGSSNEDLDTDTLRPGAASVLSRESTITITPADKTRLSDGSTLVYRRVSREIGDRGARDIPDVRSLPANTRPRIIYIPHETATVNAFLYYLYTSTLPPHNSPLITPHVLYALLQLAIPYKVDGLIEAVVARLHEGLDIYSAGPAFNAAATASGGRSALDIAALMANDDSSGSSTAERGLLRIDTRVANNGRGEAEDVPLSAASSASLASDFSRREVWRGGWSAVIGLQKRGLRALMEASKMKRERNEAEGSLKAGLGIT